MWIITYPRQWTALPALHHNRKCLEGRWTEARAFVYVCLFCIICVLYTVGFCVKVVHLQILIYLNVFMWIWWVVPDLLNLLNLSFWKELIFFASIYKRDDQTCGNMLWTLNIYNDLVIHTNRIIVGLHEEVSVKVIF